CLLLEVIPERREGRANEDQDVAGVQGAYVRQEHDRRAEDHEYRAHDVPRREIMPVPDMEQDEGVKHVGQSDQARGTRAGELEAEEEKDVVQAYEKRNPARVAEDPAVPDRVQSLPPGHQDSEEDGGKKRRPAKRHERREPRKGQGSDDRENAPKHSSGGDEELTLAFLGHPSIVASEARGWTIDR